MTSFVVNAARWLFLAVLVYAPWAFGCTRPWTIQVLDAGLGVVILLWLVGCALRRRLPIVPWPLWVSALWLAFQGWGMMANAQAVYDRQLFQFVPLKQIFPFAPGVVDRLDSIPVMLNDTAMLGTLCFIADLAQRPAWRTRLWWTAALNGIALLICGLGMKICNVHIMSAYDPTDIGWLSFAFYFYHGNAAAFINLVLPLVAGLAALAFMRRDADIQRALWLPGLLVCVASAVACISKGGMVIALVLLIVLAIWFVRQSAERGSLMLSRAQLTLLIIGGVLALAGVLSLGWGGAIDRWSEMVTPVAREEGMWERLMVSEVCLHMMGDSGFWGFGPGNFMICFPHYAAFTGNALAGLWFYAHEDYLQTIVEWGYVGGSVFAVILFGGMWSGWRRLRGAALADEDSVLLTVALIALAGVAAHATFDFPLQIASIQLYAATCLGICWGSAGMLPPVAPTRQRRSGARRSAPASLGGER